MLDNEDNHKYQYLIGYLQWTISLGIFDIYIHVMKISSFRYAQRQGHIDQTKRIYAYLDKTRNAWIQVQTEDPD